MNIAVCLSLIFFAHSVSLQEDTLESLDDRFLFPPVTKNPNEFEFTAETLEVQSTTSFPVRPPLPPIPDGRLPDVSVVKKTRPIPPEKVKVFAESGVKADEKVDDRKELVEKLGQAGSVANATSPTGFHQSLMTGTLEQEDIGLDAIAVEEVSNFMVKELDKIDDVEFIETSFGRKHCFPYPSCDHDDRFRTFDGSCNNEINALVGMASTPVIRLLPNAYEDGLHVPRSNSKVTGEALPCARDISVAIAPDINRTETVHTLMTMQWGQFIDHDLILSPTSKVSGYGGAQCCNPIFHRFVNGKPVFEEFQIPFGFHPDCLPICISPSDPFYSEFGKTCMDFVRTQGSPNIHCTMGPKEQMNALSHYIDGSMVYGSGDARANDLRDASNPSRLRTHSASDELLPPEGFSQECPRNCFRAGDVRVNEQIGLTFTHTLWMREHNRLADHYKGLGLDDEEAFQMARRLVIAEIQHVTYNEYLPVILGKKYLEHNDFQTTPLGSHYEDYNQFLDPSISNAFGAAGFRYGHTMVQGMIQLFNLGREVEESLPFRSQVFNPVGLFDPLFLTGVARGLTAQGSQIADVFFIKELTGHLFQQPHEFFGLDLVALNVQRGRDHGLPPYVDYREYCDLSPITSFEDLNLPPEILSKVQSVYNNVEDIDVFIGMLLEQPVDDSILGPTFRCIVGNQFFRLKQGDRYFYDNLNQPFPFSTAELDAIKSSVSLASVFCENVEGLQSVQPLVFYHPNDEWNKVQLCSSLPSLDLNVFDVMRK